jgi:isopentenyl-diphosphate delta-isomerase
MGNNDFLILVDEQDKQWGKLEKKLVHELGLLHRAFSVFIFNSKGEMLLQQRADDKYHSGGLWTNTCCSHPRYGEEMAEAIDRRLDEEMGIKCKTNFAFSFIYNAKFENGLTEHEFDHVYIGFSDSAPSPDASEVKSWKYLDLKSISDDIGNKPEAYTAWFKICFGKIKEQYAKSIIQSQQPHRPYASV